MKGRMETERPRGSRGCRRGRPGDLCGFGKTVGEQSGATWNRTCVGDPRHPPRLALKLEVQGSPLNPHPPVSAWGSARLGPAGQAALSLLSNTISKWRWAHAHHQGTGCVRTPLKGRLPLPPEKKSPFWTFHGASNTTGQTTSVPGKQREWLH